MTAAEQNPNRDSDAMARYKALELYRQLPVSMAGTTLAAVITAGLLWPHVLAWQVMGWTALAVANQLWRLSLYIQSRRRPDFFDCPGCVIRLWSLGGVASGAIWGMAALLMAWRLPAVSLELYGLIVFGMVSGAIPLLALHRPTLLSYVLLALLPCAALPWLMSWEGGWVVSVAIVVITLFTLKLGLSLSRSHDEALRARVRNEQLAHQLELHARKLEHALAREESLSEAKSKFFAAASHDLRQPMNAIALYTSSLGKALQERDLQRAENLTRKVSGAVVALDSLFSDVMDFSRLESGVVIASPQVLNVAELFMELQGYFAPQAFDKGLELRFRASPHIWVNTDRVCLLRILSNLLANALRYTHSGGVLVAARLKRGHIEFMVLDTGIGLAPTHRDKIFHEFYQVESLSGHGGKLLTETGRAAEPSVTARISKGLGLGLAIVQRLASLIGTRVQVTSQMGRGSRFFFSLPAHHVPTVQRDPTPERVIRTAPGAVQAAAAGRAPSHDGIRVAVAEDDVLVLDSLCQCLDDWGMNPIRFDLSTSEIPPWPADVDALDIVIADYDLGHHGDGLNFVRQVRQRLGEPIPAIMITGRISSEVVAGLGSDSIVVMEKPVDPEKLRVAISRIRPA